MRSKKNREVNIFSASVVDLFASGLGVFLIVAIIALVNQKKENHKIKGDPEVINQQNNSIITELEEKVNSLSKKLKEKQEENIGLMSAMADQRNNKISEQIKLNEQMVRAELQSEHDKDSEEKRMEIEQLRLQLQEKQEEAKELRASLKNLKEVYATMSESNNSSGSKKLNVGAFEIGTKIKLKNVQFYAGTEKTIEPYASEEIRALAAFLLENPRVRIEVSGHIFLTKDEIEKQQGFDDSDLSGRRAKAVCASLVARGVDPSRLKCVGYGGKRYLYLTNDEYSVEAQLNRRVEVEILAK